MVTNSLQDYGREQFPVPVALTIRAAWWLNADMAAVDCSCSFQESSVSCKPCKPTANCLQFLWGVWELNDLVANGLCSGQRLGGLCGGQWNEACQTHWKPLCLTYHTPARKEISGSRLWHPIHVAPHSFNRSSSTARASAKNQAMCQHH